MIEERVLKYLRNTLADSEKLQLYPTDKNDYVCSFDDILKNTLPESLVERIFEDLDEFIKKKNRDESLRKCNKGAKNQDSDDQEIVNPKTVSILTFPIVYKSRFDHKEKRKNQPEKLFPLCIPGILCRDDCLLMANNDLQIFIPRQFLFPNPQQRASTPTVADLDHHDTYLSKNNSEGDESRLKWETQIERAENLWEELTKSKLNTLEIEGYAQQSGESVILVRNTQTMTQHIFSLYDELLRLGDLDKLPLLKKILNPEDIGEPKIRQLKKDPLTYKLNKAQMQSGQTLSNTQKHVLRDVLDNPEEMVRVVNGPPGTGKTTLLQSIITNLWVQAAMEKKPAPIIVASSSNNNAIINVTNSFKSITNSDQTDIFYTRWIPNIKSFGLYCASAKKLERHSLEKGWLGCKSREPVFSVQDDLSTIEIESIAFLDLARLHFKERFRKWSGKDMTDMDEITNFLHEKLLQASHELNKICSIQKEILNFDLDLYDTQETYSQKLELWHAQRNKIQEHFRNRPFLERMMMKFLPEGLFSKLTQKQIKLLVNESPLLETENLKTAKDIRSYINLNINSLTSEFDALRQTINSYEESLKSWVIWADENKVETEITFLDKALDQNSLRHKIFYLAVHYWESRWLQDMKMIHQKRQNKTFCLKELYQVRSQLTPCFISTFHMLPAFFNTDEQYLYNAIDYLIVDEAGQVNTSISAPSFALAKKTLIVGDIKQLEPINVMPKSIDQGNCLKYGLIGKQSEYARLSKTGLSTTNGSIMHRGQALSPFKVEPHIAERGFFLKEHWRCVPEIASYCNEIAYAGALEPMRPPKKDAPFPPLGYAHINGDSKRQNGSIYNVKEAMVIIKWLSDHLQMIKETYPSTPFEKIVGVITPYRAQVEQLKKCLYESKLPKTIPIGTVHTFQGTECPIIIFSPAYGPDDSPNFISSSVNFMNVTVSRAKDHFFVFGNINVLRRSSGNCLEQLNRRLFSSQDNEIKGIDVHLTNHITLSAAIENLSTLDAHQQFLLTSLKSAKEKIMIHSPFLSINALMYDNLIGQIEECIKRGVRVCVVTDQDFESRNSSHPENALEAEKSLKEIGVELRYFYRDHSKTLYLDHHTYVIGSFNWLSASRDNRYSNRDHSVVCSNSKQISTLINKVWKQLPKETSEIRKNKKQQSYAA